MPPPSHRAEACEAYRHCRPYRDRIRATLIRSPSPAIGAAGAESGFEEGPVRIAAQSVLLDQTSMKPFMTAAPRLGAANWAIFMAIAGAPTTVVFRGRRDRRTTALATVSGASEPDGSDSLAPV